MPNNLERLLHKNLMYTIRASVGSEIFKHIYVRDIDEGHEFDALNDGEKSCAFVVSGVLALHGLIDHPHATVKKTIARMLQNDWVATNDPQPGDVVEWGAGNQPKHMAFFIGDGRVIGNATSLRKVAEYGLTLDDGREPVAYYTHPSLH